MLALLEEQGSGPGAGADDAVPVVVGGIIPDDDAEALRAMGVAAVFTPVSSLADVVAGFDEICGVSR